MKKRTKIIAISITLCMCLSLFVVGVLANITASFSVSSTLNFVADGVYVMAEGEVRLGSSKDNASLPTEIPSGSDYDYIGYSYTPISAGTNNAPDASQSATGFSDNWEIKDINFSSENKVVVYYFKFTNYSNFDVAATCVTNISTVESNLANHIDVQTYVDGSVTSVNTYNVYIPAASNNVPGEKTLEVVITLTNLMEPISQEALDFTFTFAQDNDTTKYFNIVQASDDTSLELSPIDYFALLLGMDLITQIQPTDYVIVGLSDIGAQMYADSNSVKDMTLPEEDSNGNKIVGAVLIEMLTAKNLNIKNLTIPEGYKYVAGFFDENTATINISSTVERYVNLFTNPDSGLINLDDFIIVNNVYYNVDENNTNYFSYNGALYRYGAYNNEAGNSLIYAPGANYEFSIPTDKNITCIGDTSITTFELSFPLAHREMDTFTIPNTVDTLITLMGSNAKNIVVEGDVEINIACFDKCYKLENVTFEGDSSFTIFLDSTSDYYSYFNNSENLTVVFKGEIIRNNVGNYLGPKTIKVYVENTTNLTQNALDLIIGNTFYTPVFIQNVYFLSTQDLSSVRTTLTSTDYGYTESADLVVEDGKSYVHFTHS